MSIYWFHNDEVRYQLIYTTKVYAQDGKSRYTITCVLYANERRKNQVEDTSHE